MTFTIGIIFVLKKVVNLDTIFHIFKYLYDWYNIHILWLSFSFVILAIIYSDYYILGHQYCLHALFSSVKIGS